MLESHSGCQLIYDTDRQETGQEEMPETREEEDNEKQGKYYKVRTDADKKTRKRKQSERERRDEEDERKSLPQKLFFSNCNFICSL
jgi:hypothetical protein